MMHNASKDEGHAQTVEGCEKGERAKPDDTQTKSDKNSTNGIKRKRAKINDREKRVLRLKCPGSCATQYRIDVSKHTRREFYCPFCGSLFVIKKRLRHILNPKQGVRRFETARIAQNTECPLYVPERVVQKLSSSMGKVDDVVRKHLYNLNTIRHHLSSAGALNILKILVKDILTPIDLEGRSVVEYLSGLCDSAICKTVNKRSRSASKRVVETPSGCELLYSFLRLHIAHFDDSTVPERSPECQSDEEASTAMSPMIETVAFAQVNCPSCSHDNFVELNEVRPHNHFRCQNQNCRFIFGLSAEKSPKRLFLANALLDTPRECVRRIDLKGLNRQWADVRRSFGLSSDEGAPARTAVDAEEAGSSSKDKARSTGVHHATRRCSAKLPTAIARPVTNRRKLRPRRNVKASGGM